QVQAVVLADLVPVVDTCPAEGVGANADPGGPDRGEIDDLLQGRYVGAEEIESPGGIRGDGVRVRDPADARQPVREQVVRPVLNPRGDIRAGRSAVRRVVLEAPVRGRGVR